MGDTSRMSVSLSRRQLAAALLEYDNDASDSLRPRVNARDSALFLPFKPGPPPPPTLPIPAGLRADTHPRQTYDPAKPRRSESFGAEDHLSSYNIGLNRIPRPNGEDERVLGELEDQYERVDVSMWDLPSHLVASTGAEHQHTQAPDDVERGPSRLNSILRPADLSTLRTRSVVLARPEPEVSPTAARAVSVHLDVTGSSPPMEGVLGEMHHGSEIDEILSRAERIRKLAESGRDLTFEALGELSDGVRYHKSSQETSYARRPFSDFVPPSTNSTRRMSNPIMVPLPPSPMPFARPLSSLSQTLSAYDLQEPEEEADQTPNPFALPAPPMAQASRFDPKAIQAQRQSISSMLDPHDDPHERPPSSLRPLSSQNLARAAIPSASDNRRSRVYPEIDDNPSLTGDIKVYDDIPSPTEYGKHLRASRYGPPAPRANRQSVMRPATLVMPAPLAGSERPVAEHVPEGWTLGEKPLPPGSRTSVMSIGRPALPMSLSSRTFRSSLMVDGVRDDDWIGGAEVDGEMGVVDDETRAKDEKRPGKLFGTSLMDQLEARKAHMRGKQRVFTGDSRPAMMARPTSYMSSSRQDEKRASHGPTKPLLQFDDSGQIIPSDTSEVKNRMSKSKSIFGVDQLWEKELAKLKIIEAEAERQRVLDEEKERFRKESEERKKRKGKGKAKVLNNPPPEELPLHFGAGSGHIASSSRVSVAVPTDAPPTLQHSPEKLRSGTDYFPSVVPIQQAPRTASRLRLDKWENSSDEEKSPSMPESVKGKGKVVSQRVDSSDDEEENVPLSRLAPKASVATATHAADSDSEEDVPLSKIAARSPIIISPASTTWRIGLGPPPTGSNHQPDGEDDDDVPLMLRRARAQTLTSLHGARVTNPEAIEDDLPLGYKHAEAAQRQMLQLSAPTSMHISDWWSSRTSGFGAFPGMSFPGMQQPMYPPMGMPPMVSDPFGTGYPPMMSPWGEVVPTLLPPTPSGPASHIDRWRREIRTPSVVSASAGAQSAST